MRVPVEKRSALLALSLIFTYLFFLEYLRPIRSVSIPFDLPLFHYPLADYAFTSLREGRFPLWDPTIYSGMPFAANTQAALFYPPTWLLFLGNMGSSHLSYWSMQEFVFLHVWLAFILCYWWMRTRVSRTAALFGAGIFAYSGFMMLQLQHLGLVVGVAWMPLGFLGIDQAAEQRRWLPIWKLVLASAMCFLAGYPPLWFVFAVCMGCYAAGHKRRWSLTAGVVSALVVSLLVCMVQLLPAAQLTSLKAPEDRYGGGIQDPLFYLSYLIPDLFHFGLGVDPRTNPGREYLYLGAPAIAGLLLMFRRTRTGEHRPSLLPFLFVLGASAVLLINPLNLVGVVVHGSTFLSQICRDWYFLAGIPLPIAGLAAIGLDRFLKTHGKPWPRWTAIAFAGIVIAWSGRQLWLWLPGGAELAHGWASALDASAQLALFGAGVVMLRSHAGFARAFLLGALVLTTAVDYKVHGTSKRFNATRHQAAWIHGKFEPLAPAVYDIMRANRQFRVLVDRTGPFPQMLRHVQLTTPQGFDPFLTTGYKDLVQGVGGLFYTNWEFAVDPANEQALKILGVRYFVTAREGPLYPALVNHPRFKLLEPSLPFYKVFEYQDASPPYGWGDGSVERIDVTRWDPERRGFAVAASTVPRTFRLSEQWAPGWTARVDGASVPIERWQGALQSVVVPPQAQCIEFVYWPGAVLSGAAMSALSIAGLILAAVFLRRLER